MTGFLIYLVMFSITWVLLAKSLYNSQMVKEVSDPGGEQVAVTLVISGVASMAWFISLPLALLFLTIRAVARIYGTNFVEVADKWLDTSKK